MRRLPIQNFIFGADFQRGRHDVTLPFDVTLEDILVPGYWATVANMLKVGSIIEAHRADYSLDVQLRVVKVERGLAVVQPLTNVNAETEEKIRALRDRSAAAAASGEPDNTPKAGPDYKVGFAPGQGFYVQFKPTKETIFKGIATSAEAHKKAIEHEARAGGNKAAA